MRDKGDKIYKFVSLLNFFRKNSIYLLLSISEKNIEIIIGEKWNGFFLFLMEKIYIYLKCIIWREIEKSLVGKKIFFS